MAIINNYLDRYLEPVTAVFTPDVARKIVDLKPDAEMIARIGELGDKAQTGMLSEDETEEYEDYIDMGDFISLLKAKARRFLASQTG